MPQPLAFLPLFAVTLDATPMDITANRKAQALHYGAEDMREFAHMAPFAVASISPAPSDAQPSPSFESIEPEVAVESASGVNYVVTGKYHVVVSADGPYNAGLAALALACSGDVYEKSAQSYEAAVRERKVPLVSTTAVELPDADQIAEEVETPCPI